MAKDQWIGSAILLASVLTTTVNEQRLIRHTNSLGEGLSVVIALPNPVASSQNDGKLVLFSGAITTDPDVLRTNPKASRSPYALDPVFGIAARGVRLYRVVEMFQWVETAHTITGRNGVLEDDDEDRGVDEHREKTYTYDLRWRSDRIDSASFHDMSYQNPSEDAWIYQSKEIDADGVVVGDFKLSNELISQIKRKDPIQLNSKAMHTMRVVLDQRLGTEWTKATALKDFTVEDDYFYLLRDGPGRPSLGDIRVSYTVTPPYPVTISGHQERNRVVPFATKAGEPLLLLEDGIHSAQELFDSKALTMYQHNRFYRLFSTTLGFLGFLVLHPILSRRFGAEFSGLQKHLVCCILSGGVTFSVAGICWVFYRPLWALVLAFSGLSPSLALAFFVRAATQRRSASASKNQ